MYDTFLFDMDGTLIRMKLNFRKIREDLEKMIGKMGTSILETVDKIKDETLRKKAIEYIEKEEEKAAERSELIEGTLECLRYLKKKNVKIGIITRNNRKSSIMSAENTKIIDYIDLILSRDDVEKVKPDPMHIQIALKKLNSEPEKSVVVGDHRFEIEAGKKLGCLTIGVLSGSGTRETLKNADLIFKSIKEFYEDWIRKKI